MSVTNLPDPNKHTIRIDLKRRQATIEGSEAISAVKVLALTLFAGFALYVLAKWLGVL
jgi:UDP-N-acetylglucosamine enolpyruvyl transferase